MFLPLIRHIHYSRATQIIYVSMVHSRSESYREIIRRMNKYIMIASCAEPQRETVIESEYWVRLLCLLCTGTDKIINIIWLNHGRIMIKFMTLEWRIQIFHSHFHFYCQSHVSAARQCTGDTPPYSDIVIILSNEHRRDGVSELPKKGCFPFAEFGIFIHRVIKREKYSFSALKFTVHRNRMGIRTIWIIER